jgi:cysteine-rich repeat protein
LGDKCDIGAFEEGCGDGTKETNEECDDDNNTDGDGCSSICKLESNGNLNDPNGGGCSLSTHPFRPNHDGLGIIFVMTLFGITILRKRKT